MTEPSARTTKFDQLRISPMLAVCVNVGLSPLMSMIQAPPRSSSIITLSVAYLIAGMVQLVVQGRSPTLTSVPLPDGSMIMMSALSFAFDVASNMTTLPFDANHARG